MLGLGGGTGLTTTTTTTTQQQQLMLDKLSGHTSQHWVLRQSLGHKQMCFMSPLPVGEATINTQFLPGEFLERNR